MYFIQELAEFVEGFLSLKTDLKLLMVSAFLFEQKLEKLVIFIVDGARNG